ncbi:hypothetical protein SERLA73DRAFT_49623 [Serpula lacrymans var. lacrymans S7.3]|uniref:ubiquitinyl hydrolase 1 n=2 Tax=Serpula lacrymans var. lacrymans TaxID=341189 RepID=F8PQT8_SERL3|nr:uncharacterized protein SERLADRAFT_435802 [Serpula lacrymans var. lacrymans S7.9]EGO02282.1 hypothetical protein SERLA73DRAFT_49623 [Serpula lacrymans var. lacrymans S7.3]EGO28024.1 hypothetical protein SERLADRAFT_435802 [Serpula lacrymans var. lacrymans S7.9]
MVFEVLDSLLHWSWSYGSSTSTSSHESKKLKKKHVRSRAEQIALNGYAKPGSTNGEEHVEGHYPGLVNISGTYCFMNSTLQAMASLSYLQPYIDAVHAKAEALDVPSPVIDALQDLLRDLNSPQSSYNSIRPMAIISALADHSSGKHNSLFSSREHQDAQELFQLVSECIKKEVLATDKEEYRDRGFGGLSRMGEANREIGKSVFDGLTANRRSCMECGYTEAVMHFAFDSWQLAVPRMAASCGLEECLAEYTKLELLTDCICRKCSMVATHHRLVQEADRLADVVNADPDASSSKKRRAKDARKLELKVKAALDQGRIEDDIKGVKMEKVFSRASTKQAMIARPPPVLALHLNRSLHYGQYAAKNTIRIVFPEILDLTPFSTSGNLSTAPSVPISSPPPALPRSTTPTPATYATSRTLYRLSAVVCHYGQHSFGHYVCYRRKPRPTSVQPRYTPPKQVDPLDCECAKCQRLGPIRDDDDALDSIYRPGHGWLRISDDSVRECGIESVLQEGAGAFMLYYERVISSRPGILPLHDSPRSSEETLKAQSPIPVRLDINRSTLSLSSLRPDGMDERSMLGARIVRSVAAGRGRSQSATPSERNTTVEPSENGHATPFRAPTANGDATSHIPNQVKASPSKSSSLTSSSSSKSPKSPPQMDSLHSCSTSSSHSRHHPLSSKSHRIQSPQSSTVIGLTA